MSANKQTGSAGGIGLLGLLTIAFIVLKLTHFVTWSWWWVLSPIWGPFGIAIGCWVMAMVVIAVGGMFIRKP